jgi:hypothetical protein
MRLDGNRASGVHRSPKMEKIPAMAGILYLLWGAGRDRRIRS